MSQGFGDPRLIMAPPPHRREPPASVVAPQDLLQAGQVLDPEQENQIARDLAAFTDYEAYLGNRPPSEGNPNIPENGPGQAAAPVPAQDFILFPDHGEPDLPDSPGTIVARLLAHDQYDFLLGLRTPHRGQPPQAPRVEPQNQGFDLPAFYNLGDREIDALPNGPNLQDPFEQVQEHAAQLVQEAGASQEDEHQGQEESDENKAEGAAVDSPIVGFEGTNSTQVPEMVNPPNALQSNPGPTRRFLSHVALPWVHRQETNQFQNSIASSSSASGIVPSPTPMAQNQPADGDMGGANFRGDQMLDVLPHPRSCLRCYIKKRGCDRQRPCYNCQKHGLGWEDCKLRGKGAREFGRTEVTLNSPRPMRIINVSSKRSTTASESKKKRGVSTSLTHKKNEKKKKQALLNAALAGEETEDEIIIQAPERALGSMTLTEGEKKRRGTVVAGPDP